MDPWGAPVSGRAATPALLRRTAPVSSGFFPGGEDRQALGAWTPGDGAAEPAAAPRYPKASPAWPACGLRATSLSPRPVFTACLLPLQKARPTVEKSCRHRTLAPKLVSTGATRSAWPPASVRTELPPVNIRPLSLGGHREPCLTQKSDRGPNPTHLPCDLGKCLSFSGPWSP